jgi:predicted NBD/HSP70 family sugar kinase
MTDVVLAIDFGGTKTAVGCATTEGDLLLSHRMPTYPSPSDRGVEGVVGRAFTAAEPRLRRLVDAAVAEFSRQLANFATRLDPQRIVIGGGLMNAAERLREPLAAALAKISPFPAEIVPSAFVRDASLLCAAALACDAVAGR